MSGRVHEDVIGSLNTKIVETLLISELLDHASSARSGSHVLTSNLADYNAFLQMPNKS